MPIRSRPDETQPNTVSITFADGQEIWINDFSNFFYYFKASYAFLSGVHSIDEMTITEALAPKSIAALKSLDWQGDAWARVRSFRRRLETDDIYITRVHMDSPINIDLKGSVKRILVLLAICGGQIVIREAQLLQPPKRNGLLTRL